MGDPKKPRGRRAGLMSAILRSFVGFCELIQNAMDAVDAP